MNIQEYAKDEIARNLIETAITLFEAGTDLFSVITLAGAAEVILGQLLGAQNGTREKGSILRVLRPAKRHSDNDHAFWGAEMESSIHMDARQEALFLLRRCIEDYRLLKGGLSARMESFDSHFRSGSEAG